MLDRRISPIERIFSCGHRCLDEARTLRLSQNLRLTKFLKFKVVAHDLGLQPEEWVPLGCSQNLAEPNLELASRPDTFKDVAIHQLKISLMDVRPLIWRRVLVQDSLNLRQLHQVLQIVMGWKNSHLHRFTVDRLRHRGRFAAFDNQPHPTSQATLQLLLSEQDTKFLYYEYDFGDGWIHEVRNEEVLLPELGKRYPFCIGGERACPPEDCGGSDSYQKMLRVLRDECDPDHASTVDWIGQDFDPEAFDADVVNRRLKQLKVRPRELSQD